MKTLLALLLSTLVSGSLLAQGPDDQCEWNAGPPTFGAPSNLVDTACVDVSPLTVIHLDSTGCECLADVRVVGAFRSCGSVWTTIGQSGGCEEYTYSMNITAVSSSLGNTMGTSMSGTTSGQPPPIFYVDAQVIPCDDVFVFSMNSE